MGGAGQRAQGWRAPKTHVLATTAAEFPACETQKWFHGWLAGRLKRTRQRPCRSTMNSPTCIEEWLSEAHRTNMCLGFGGSPRAIRASSPVVCVGGWAELGSSQGKIPGAALSASRPG